MSEPIDLYFLGPLISKRRSASVCGVAKLLLQIALVADSALLYVVELLPNMLCSAAEYYFATRRAAMACGETGRRS